MILGLTCVDLVFPLGKEVSVSLANAWNQFVGTGQRRSALTKNKDQILPWRRVQVPGRASGSTMFCDNTNNRLVSQVGTGVL